MSEESRKAPRRDVGFGVVGCGGIGRWHARLIGSLPGLRLVGVVDVLPRAAESLARATASRAFGSSQELFESDEVEVACICTPPATHCSLALEGAARGKHLLVEKPLALSTAEVDRMLDACRRTAVHLGVVHQQRGQAAARAVAELARGGSLGRLLVGALTHTWHAGPRRVAEGSWRGDRRLGGGLLYDQLVHGIDLLLWYLGEPEWVAAGTAFLGAGSGAEDTTAAVVGFRGGALATIAGTSVANRMRDDIALDLAGTEGGCRLEIRDYDNCELVQLDLSPADGARARGLSPAEIQALLDRHQGSWRRGPRALSWRLLARLAGSQRGSRGFRSPRSVLRRRVDRAAQRERGEPQAHAAILSSMARAARGGEHSLVRGEEARGSIALIEAILRSQELGGARVVLGGEGGQ